MRFIARSVTPERVRNHPKLAAEVFDEDHLQLADQKAEHGADGDHEQRTTAVARKDSAALNVTICVIPAQSAMPTHVEHIRLATGVAAVVAHPGAPGAADL